MAILMGINTDYFSFKPPQPKLRKHFRHRSYTSCVSSTTHYTQTEFK
jgi:hypothetical protein